MFVLFSSVCMRVVVLGIEKVILMSFRLVFMKVCVCVFVWLYELV